MIDLDTKHVLISLHPQWIQKILTGEKTIEVRRRGPVLKTPFKVYLYCTKKGAHLHSGDVSAEARIRSDRYNYLMNGLVCGVAICTKVAEIPTRELSNNLKGTCLSEFALKKYAGGADHLSYMYLEKPVMFEGPVSLLTFHLLTPPQSWQYIEERQIW